MRWGVERRLPPAGERLVAGRHRPGVPADLASGLPAGAGVVADHVHPAQTLQRLAGLFGVAPRDDLAAGTLAAGGVGVDGLVAAGGQPAKAGADEGDLVAFGGQAAGEPADLVQAAEAGGRDGRAGRR